MSSMNFRAPNTWLRVLERVLLDGEETQAVVRGEYNSDGTKELVACQSCVDMHYPVMTNKQRKLNYRFMAAEAWWILTGQDTVATIAPYNKVMAKFSDDGETFFGAYGPRIAGQREYVLQALMKDLQTRQAVMNIWRPCPPQSKDIPCTVSIQFLVRDGKLHCVDTMRSSDLWLGWSYDVFNFSMLALSIILDLRKYKGIHLKLGNLWLTAGSQHIYQRDLDGVLACLDDPTSIVEHEPFFTPSSFKSSLDLELFLKDCADGKKSILNQAE